MIAYCDDYNKFTFLNITITIKTIVDVAVNFSSIKKMQQNIKIKKKIFKDRI